MSKYWKVLFLLFPLIVYGLGAGSNQLVERINNGMMPVEVPVAYKEMFPSGTVLDDYHIAAGPSTVFRKLDDRIKITGQIESIGDVLLDIGSDLSFPFLGLAAILVVIKSDKNKKTLSL